MHEYFQTAGRLKIACPSNIGGGQNYFRHTIYHDQIKNSFQQDDSLISNMVTPNRHMSNEMRQHFLREGLFTGDHEQEVIHAMDSIQNEIMALSAVRDQIQSGYLSAGAGGPMTRVTSSEKFHHYPSQHAHVGMHQQFSQHHSQHHQIYSGQQSFDPRTFSPRGIDGFHLAQQQQQQHEGTYHPARDAYALHFADNLLSPKRRSLSSDSGSPATPSRFYHDSPPQTSVELDELSCHYGQHLAPRKYQQQHARFVSHKAIYMVQFKNRLTEYVTSPLVDHLTFSPGDFVIVTAEPFGEDLGVVVEVLNEREYDHMLQHATPKNSRYRPKQRPDVFGQILRMATITERQQLPTKQSLESDALQVANRVAFNVIGMRDLTIYDAEYTFDRTKLTFYYKSDVHVDFRELVKDMFMRFKTRIWMKKMNQELPFYPRKYATVQLLTGAQLQPQ